MVNAETVNSFCGTFLEYVKNWATFFLQCCVTSDTFLICLKLFLFWCVIQYVQNIFKTNIVLKLIDEVEML